MAADCQTTFSFVRCKAGWVIAEGPAGLGTVGLARLATQNGRGGRIRKFGWDCCREPAQ